MDGASTSFVRIGSGHPQTILGLPHSPGAVACASTCERRPPSFPQFLRSAAAKPARAGDRVEWCEPCPRPPAGVSKDDASRLLPKLADVLPVPAKVRPELVQRVYMLQRRVTTGNMIDIAI